jgi:hypothetical protein
MREWLKTVFGEEEFNRWFVKWTVADWVRAAIGSAVVSLVGLISSHFTQLAPVWKGGFGGALVSSLLIAGTAVFLASRSKRKPVPSAEVGKFNQLLESYMKGENILFDLGGEPQLVTSTTTTSSGYVHFGPRKDANTIDFHVSVNVAPLSHDSSNEHWSRLDSLKRSQFTQALLPAAKSQGRSFDVMIANLPQSDCRDLGIDLRDAIHNAGLGAMGIQEMISPTFPPGITVEANKSDPLLPKLLEAFRQIGLVPRFQHQDTNALIVRIGRRLG